MPRRHAEARDALEEYRQAQVRKLSDREVRSAVRSGVTGPSSADAMEDELRRRSAAPPMPLEDDMLPAVPRARARLRQVESMEAKGYKNGGRVASMDGRELYSAGKSKISGPATKAAVKAEMGRRAGGGGSVRDAVVGRTKRIDAAVDGYTKGGKVKGRGR